MIKIIVGDSSPLIGLGFERLLESENNIELKGFANNRKQLFDFITKYRPDIIFLDYTSDEFSSIDIAQIKLLNSHTKTIGFTNDITPETLNTAIQNGVVSHIKKSCSLNEILKSIEETFKDNHFFCGELLDLLKSKTKPNLNNRSCDPIALSDREMDVVKLISEGYTNAQIAVVLHISNHTVNTHRKNIMRKLGVGNTAGIVLFAVKSNLVSPEKFNFEPNEN